MGVRKKTRNQRFMSCADAIAAAQSAGKHPACQIPGAELPSDEPLNPRERIWQVVAAIPSGSVATYGQVARLAGLPNHARLVGRTLRDLPDGTRLPWHRVVNARLCLSPRGDASATAGQRARLEEEGVAFIGAKVARAHLWAH